MKFLFTLIISVSVSASINARAVNFAADIDCYIKHLKTLKRLQCDFPLHEVASTEFDDCDAAVEGFAKSIYDEQSVKLLDDETTAEIVPCMIEEMKANKVADNRMLAKVFDMSTQMSAVTKKERIDELEAKNEASRLDSLQRCFADQVFGVIFDGMFKAEKASSIESYCKRRFVVDNGMIDRKIYHFVTNPNNVVDATAKCPEVVSAMVPKLEAIMEAQIKPTGVDEALNDSEVSCIMKQYRKNHFFNNMLLVSIFYDLNISEERKKIERKNFITVLTDSAFYKCREVRSADATC